MKGFITFLIDEFDANNGRKKAYNKSSCKRAYRAGDEHGFKRGFNEGREIGKAEGMAEQKERDAEIVWREMMDGTPIEDMPDKIRNQGNDDEC